MNIKKFLSPQEKGEIVRAIALAEEQTSGEIRVHMEKKCGQHVLDRAAHWFKKLKMHRTELRNGVLIYLAVQDKKFAILGDVGINRKVPAGFWDDVKDHMGSFFSQGKFTEGLTEGIRMVGEHLKEHFPHQDDDRNELSNDISFG
jgi:uncharacterized membrane protein